MSPSAQVKKKCYSFYKSDGWDIAKNKAIASLKFKFDILKRRKEKKALYFINNPRRLKEFISVSKMMRMGAPRYNLVLCIPLGLRLQLKMMMELGEAGIELIALEGGTIKVLTSERIRKKMEKERIQQIRKKLIDINLISSVDARIGFKIFKIDKKVFKRIRPILENESDYLKQILNLNLILDGINTKEIRKKYNPNKTQIKKGAIFLLEWMSSKLKLNINKEAFFSFRKIRKLRKEEPVHLGNTKDIKELEKIKKELTGDKRPNKFILWESALRRFLLCLDYIKYGMKNK